MAVSRVVFKHGPYGNTHSSRQEAVNSTGQYFSMTSAPYIDRSCLSKASLHESLPNVEENHVDQGLFEPHKIPGRLDVTMEEHSYSIELAKIRDAVRKLMKQIGLRSRAILYMHRDPSIANAEIFTLCSLSRSLCGIDSRDVSMDFAQHRC